MAGHADRLARDVCLFLKERGLALVQIIYVSAARPEASAAQLDAILEAAARHNQRQGITGMLLYAGGSFLQVLEGEEEAVDETFRRISRDARHAGIMVIQREHVAERSFSQWNMGFRRLKTEDAAAHPAYAPFFEHGFDARQIGARPGLAMEILAEFAHGQRAEVVR